MTWQTMVQKCATVTSTCDKKHWLSYLKIIFQLLMVLRFGNYGHRVWWQNRFFLPTVSTTVNVIPAKHMRTGVILSAAKPRRSIHMHRQHNQYTLEYYARGRGLNLLWYNLACVLFSRWLRKINVVSLYDYNCTF